MFYLLIEKILLKQFNRLPGPWALRGFYENDISIKLPIGHGSANYQVALQSSIDAFKKRKSERVITIEDEGSFGMSINDPDLINLLNYLKQSGREVDLLNLITK